VIVPAVNADHHAFVHFAAMADKQASAFLQIKQRIGQSLAVSVGDQYPVVSSSDGGIDVRAVAIEHVVHQTGPRSRAEEFGLKADQATGGNNVIQAYTSLAVRHHVLQLAAARAQLFHHGALVGVLDIDGKL